MALAAGPSTSSRAVPSGSTTKTPSAPATSSWAPRNACTGSAVVVVVLEADAVVEAAIVVVVVVDGAVDVGTVDGAPVVAGAVVPPHADTTTATASVVKRSLFTPLQRSKGFDRLQKSRRTSPAAWRSGRLAGTGGVDAS